MECNQQKTMLGRRQMLVVKHTFLEVTDSDSDSDDKPVCRSKTDPAVCQMNSGRSSSRGSSSESEMLMGHWASEAQDTASITSECGLSQATVAGSAAHPPQSHAPEASSSLLASSWHQDLGCSIGKDVEAAGISSTTTPSSMRGAQSHDGVKLDSGESDDEEGELTWRHLRTLSFSDEGLAEEGDDAGTEGGTAASCNCIGTHVLLPAQRSSRTPIQPQPHLQVPQLMAVYPLAVMAPLSAAAAAPASSTAPATTPGPVNAMAAASEVTSRDRQRRDNHTIVKGTNETAHTVGSACTVETRTSLMIRNIPNNFTRSRFLSLLDDAGFAGLYDFVYLPVDLQTGASLGYAFLNLREPSVVKEFWHAFEGFRRWGVPSKKRGSVSWSDPYQGFEANVDHYRNSPIMHFSVPDAYKPIVFRNGVRIPYPAPTKNIRAPRLRR